MRIAVFESNELCSRNISETLRAAGHEVFEIWPATDAVSRIKLLNPDLVLLDDDISSMYTGINTVEIAKKLRLDDWRLISTSKNPSGYCRKQWTEKYDLVIPESVAHSSLLEIVGR